MNTSTYLPQSQAQPPTTVQATGPPAWTAGRITAVVLGTMLMLVSSAIGMFGATLALADNGLRDDDGFLMSGDETFATASYAMVSKNVEFHADGGAELLPQRLLGDAKITAVPNGDAPIFIGVAATADVEAYLDGVGHATFVGFGDNEPLYTTSAGTAPATVPAQAGIWVAQSSGTGIPSVEWEIETGDWTVVVMNADGSRGVSAEVAAGATVPALGWLVALTLSMTGVMLLVALVLLVVGLRRP